MAPLVATLLLGAACATGGGTGAPGEGEDATSPTTIELRIENEIVPRTSLAVQLRSSGGTREFVGRVGPGRTETFNHTVPSLSGSYVLEAESAAGGGEPYESRSFTLFARAEVTWSLPENNIIVGYRARSAD